MIQTENSLTIYYIFNAVELGAIKYAIKTLNFVSYKEKNPTKCCAQGTFHIHKLLSVIKYTISMLTKNVYVLFAVLPLLSS